MAHPDTDVTLVLQAQCNIKQMLSARKITGTDVEFSLDIDDFIWGIQRGEHWAVIFVNDINKKTIMSIFDFCTPETQERKITNAIVVFRNKCTPTASKEMLQYEPTKMEQFKLDQVIVCPVLSKMVPEYELLSDEDAQTIRNLYGESRLPTILTIDPIQRYYNAPIGGMYRITARYGALQPEIKYRVVREPTT
jgi:DNA-directed RNA polymerase subunit H (RpoH/RPB5)